MQVANRRERFNEGAVGQHVLQQVLQDVEASGRLRRRSDAVYSGVVRELVSRAWMDWDDERLVLTEVGREGLTFLRLRMQSEQALARRFASAEEVGVAGCGTDRAPSASVQPEARGRFAVWVGALIPTTG